MTRPRLLDLFAGWWRRHRPPRARYVLTGNASHNYRLVPNPNGADYRVLDWTEVDFFLAHPDVEDQRGPVQPEEDQQP